MEIQYTVLFFCNSFTHFHMTTDCSEEVGVWFLKAAQMLHIHFAHHLDTQVFWQMCIFCEHMVITCKDQYAPCKVNTKMAGRA